MHHSGGFAVVVLAQRVGRFAPDLREFAGRGDHRSPQGLLEGVVRRNQAHVVGSRGDGQDCPALSRPSNSSSDNSSIFSICGKFGYGSGPAKTSRSIVGRSRRGKMLCERPSRRDDRGQDGLRSRGQKRFSFAATVQENRRPETLLNRYRTVTRVTLAGPTGRLLIDFHPRDRRGANIEIIHSLKLHQVADPDLLDFGVGLCRPGRHLVCQPL